MIIQESSQISFIDANFHIPINPFTAAPGYWYMILIKNASSPLSRWIHGAIITSLLCQNDVATSSCRNNEVIITPCAHWVCDVYSGQTIMFHWKYSISPLHSSYCLPLIIRWRICVLSETSYAFIVNYKQKLQGLQGTSDQHPLDGYLLIAELAAQWLIKITNST